MVLFTTVHLYGLDLVHWLVVLGVPVIAIVMTLVAHRALRTVVDEVNDAVQALHASLSRDDTLTDTLTHEGTKAVVLHYLKDADVCYDGRFWPDPHVYFTPNQALGDDDHRTLTPRRAVALGLLALMGLIVALVTLALCPIQDATQRLLVLLVPPAFALGCALLVWGHTTTARAVIGRTYARLSDRLAASPHVFRDKVGLSALVHQLERHDDATVAGLDRLTAATDRLASSALADSVERSVRQVMEREVAPAIHKACDALVALTDTVVARQERGMDELATAFSHQVSEHLAASLAPIAATTEALHTHLSDTTRCLETQVQTMTAIQETNTATSNALNDTLQALTEAQTHLRDELEVIRNHIALIGATTEKMEALYTGEHDDLAAHIHHLAAQINQYAIRLDTSVGESSKSLLAAAKLAERQDEAMNVWIERLDSQLERLSDVGRIIADNTNHFTKEAESFVRQSLSEYDAGLAEVVERLAFTTAAIRDAIDALPEALRPGVSS